MKQQTRLQNCVTMLARAREEYSAAPAATCSALIKKYGAGLALPKPRSIDTVARPDSTWVNMVAPFWDEKRQGVHVPLLGITIDAKDTVHRCRYDKIRAITLGEGKRLMTMDEAMMVIFFRDAINVILQAHGGDKLEGHYWTSTPCEGSSNHFIAASFAPANIHAFDILYKGSGLRAVSEI
jgi:hypothetical protein